MGGGWRVAIARQSHPVEARDTMSSESFSDVWRTVKLHVPGAGVFLCRDWVQSAYKELCGLRPWSFLRGSLQIQIQASRTVNCTPTVGSPIVTSDTASFLITDESRQFQTSYFPTYTILSYVNASQIILDQPYGVDMNGMPIGSVLTDTAGTVLDQFYTTPADFGRFILIGDPYYQRRLAFWIDQDQLNILDPTRQASDTGPRVLASYTPSTYAGGNFPSTLGQIRYEYWPRPTAARTYPAMYQKTPITLGDSSMFSGVLYNRAVHVLQLGALAHAARWPGAPDAKNPYFSPATAKMLSDDFHQEAQRLGLADDDHYSNDLAMVHWERWPLADLAYNDKSLRATDATLADLY
jgi:hypothetical protein